MTNDAEPAFDPPEKTADPDSVPDIEDAYASESPAVEEVGEDDPDLLSPESRSLNVGDAPDDGADPSASATEPVASPAATTDDTSDTAAIVDDDKDASGTTAENLSDWPSHKSAQRIAIELKHVESEVRKLLKDRDTRRKRRLAGTRRWNELEEDIISWRFRGRFDESTLARLQELIAKRHYLFTRLQFVVGVRPDWRM